MNQLTIIGNLTRDPELRTTPSGVAVCTLSVAVNRRARQGQQPEADYFNVSVWREQGENCAKWLTKGRKVAVTGPVTARAYNRTDGSAGASLEVQAYAVEFLSSPRSEEPHAQEPPRDAQTGMEQVDAEDELPF